MAVAADIPLCSITEHEKSVARENNVYIVPRTPQVSVLMTRLRDAQTTSAEFQWNADRIVRTLVEYSLGFLPTRPIVVKTPTGMDYQGVEFAGEGVCGVSVVRAGEAMERALRDCCPGIRIGKVLVQRDESSPDKAPDPRHSYVKVPADIARRHVLLMDPMVATGGSVCRVISALQSEHKVDPSKIVFCSVLAAPSGIQRVRSEYPGVTIVTMQIDAGLNEHKFIVPGLGDFGDRYFGTEHSLGA